MAQAHWLLILALTSVTAPQPKAQDCQATTPAWQHMAQQRLHLFDASGTQLHLVARIADEAYEMAAGYQWICPEHAQDTAVLFVFSRPYQGSFYMKNVFLPLDILFFDREKRLINTARMQPVPPGSPEPLRYYRPERPAWYALELPAGRYQSVGLNPSHLRFEIRP